MTTTPTLPTTPSGASPTHPAAGPDPAGPPARTPRGPMADLMVWGGGVLAALLLVNAGVQAADWLSMQRAEHTETFAATDHLEVHGVGDVTVQVDPEASGTVVHVADRWGFVKPSLTATTRDDDTLALRSSCDGPLPWRGNTGVCTSDLTITVAPGTVVDLDSADGAITANGLEGDVTAHSADGDVHIGGSGGDVTATTSSGRVDVTGVRGNVSAKSSDGDVSVSAVGGNVSATTSDGRVTVAAVDGDADARSTDGDVEVRSVQGNVVAKTSAGSATVYAAPDAGPVALTIKTSDGSRRVEAPTDPNASRTVEIRSGDGDVAYLAG